VKCFNAIIKYFRKKRSKYINTKILTKLKSKTYHRGKDFIDYDRYRKKSD